MAPSPGGLQSRFIENQVGRERERDSTEFISFKLEESILPSVKGEEPRSLHWLTSQKPLPNRMLVGGGNPREHTLVLSLPSYFKVHDLT